MGRWIVRRTRRRGLDASADTPPSPLRGATSPFAAFVENGKDQATDCDALTPKANGTGDYHNDQAGRLIVLLDSLPAMQPLAEQHKPDNR